MSWWQNYIEKNPLKWLQDREVHTFIVGYIRDKKKDTLCCTPKTNTMLYVKYINKNEKIIKSIIWKKETQKV